MLDNTFEHELHKITHPATRDSLDSTASRPSCLPRLRVSCWSVPSKATSDPTPTGLYNNDYSENTTFFPFNFSLINLSSFGWGNNGCHDSDDDEDISEYLLEEVNGDFPRARRRHCATLRWRTIHQIDRILDRGMTPSPLEFGHVLGLWPRWLQGRTIDGDLVMYEELGKVTGAKLRAARLSPAVLARHMALICEYIIRCVDIYEAASDNCKDKHLEDSIGTQHIDDESEKQGPPRDVKHVKIYSQAGRNNWHDAYTEFPPRPRLTLIISMAGISSASFFADMAVRRALQVWGHILAAHYPGLVHRILLVNVPAWLSRAPMSLFKPLGLFPQVWKKKMWLVLPYGSKNTPKRLEGSHRALPAWTGPSPSTRVLHGLDEIIDPRVLSAEVCPGDGLNEDDPINSQEWGLLQHIIHANHRPE